MWKFLFKLNSIESDNPQVDICGLEPNFLELLDGLYYRHGICLSPLSSQKFYLWNALIYLSSSLVFFAMSEWIAASPRPLAGCRLLSLVLLHNLNEVCLSCLGSFPRISSYIWARQQVNHHLWKENRMLPYRSAIICGRKIKTVLSYVYFYDWLYYCQSMSTVAFEFWITRSHCS